MLPVVVRFCGIAFLALAVILQSPGTTLNVFYVRPFIYIYIYTQNMPLNMIQTVKEEHYQL